MLVSAGRLTPLLRTTRPPELRAACAVSRIQMMAELSLTSPILTPVAWRVLAAPSPAASADDSPATPVSEPARKPRRDRSLRRAMNLSLLLRADAEQEPAAL